MDTPKALRYTVIIFFIYLLAEGVLRKWIIPSVPGVVLYGIKYALLGLTAFIYFRNKEWLYCARFEASKEIYTATKIYVIVLALSALTLTMFYNGPIVASITLIQYSVPVILIYVIPSLIIDEKSLKYVIKAFLVITICVMVLGVVQYFSPPLSPINKYAEEMKNGIARVGNAARICSVFSYITPLGDFCIICGTFIFTLILSKPDVKYYRLILVLTLILVIIVSFMTGSRTVVIILFSSLIFLILKEIIAKGNTNMATSIGIVIILAIWLYNDVGISAIDNFIDRTKSASDTDLRVSRLFDYSRMIDSAGWFGYGIGIANLSVSSMLLTSSPIDFEEEIGRIVLEFGLFGFLLITFIRFYIWIKLFRITRSIVNSKLKLLSLSTLIVITPMTCYVQLCLYNWFAYMMYFTMIGLNIALSNIDEES